MLSRMAESLYWIGRYVERAEQTARITDATFNHTLAMGSTPDAGERRRRHWEALLEIVGGRAAFAENGAAVDDESVPAFVTFADENPNSIVNCIGYARENARTLRHQVATEMWEVLSRFHFEVQRPARRHRAGTSAGDALLFCRSVVEFSQLFQGVTDSTMPREEGWCFLQAGKFLERAEKTARALDVNHRLLVGEEAPGAEPRAAAEPAPDPRPWANVLRSLSAYEAYYRVSSTGVQSSGVIELLTLSAVIPRSIRFAIARIEEALEHITEEAPTYNGSEWLSGGGTNEARRAVGRLHGELAYQRVDDLFAHGLHAYLLEVQRRCYVIGELMEEEFFAHRALSAQETVP
jgi:uncharacterized alpha-E superfamily protein